MLMRRPDGRRRTISGPSLLVGGGGSSGRERAAPQIDASAALVGFVSSCEWLEQERNLAPARRRDSNGLRWK